jgi:hypothetical protein
MIKFKLNVIGILARALLILQEIWYRWPDAALVGHVVLAPSYLELLPWPGTEKFDRSIQLDTRSDKSLAVSESSTPTWGWGH